MSNDILNQFGEDFIHLVRDNTIETYERIKIGGIASKNKIILFEKLESMTENDKIVLDSFVSNIIDLMLFNVLNFMDENCQVMYDEENINMLSDGLAGELYSEEGWIKKYSKYDSTEDL